MILMRSPQRLSHPRKRSVRKTWLEMERMPAFMQMAFLLSTCWVFILTMLRAPAMSDSKQFFLGSWRASMRSVSCKQSTSISEKSMRISWQLKGSWLSGRSFRYEMAMGLTMEIDWLAKSSLLWWLLAKDLEMRAERDGGASLASGLADPELDLFYVGSYNFIVAKDQSPTISQLGCLRSNYNTPFFGMANNYDFMLKFILIGDSSVGKSCLLLRFTEGRFKAAHEPTLGVEFGSRSLQLKGYSIKVQLWDTAGQESFKSITRSYYKSSIAAFLVFDLTKRDSFDSIAKWLHEVRNNSHDKIQTILLGNKSDLNDIRQVSTEEAQKFAETHGLEYYETSAQSGARVEEVFKSVAERIVGMIDSKEINPESETAYGIKRGKKQRSSSVSPTKSPPEEKPSLQSLKPQPARKTCCGG